MEYIQKKKSQEELIRTTPVQLNPFYKEKVNRYFNTISKNNDRISFEIKFVINNQMELQKWIETVIISENKVLGDLNYIFCSDEYLLRET